MKVAVKKLLLSYNSTEAMRRFLLPIISVICFASTSLSISLKIIPLDYYTLRIAAIFLNGFLALISIKFCSESNKWDNKKYYLWSAIAFLTISSISITASIYELFSLTIGLLFSLSITPFFRKKVNEEIWCNFKSVLANNLFFSFLVAAILIIGTFVIIASIGYLFSINIDSKIYINVVTIYLSLFVPLYIIATIPKKFNSKEKIKNSKAIRFLTEYVSLPLVLLYAIILYVYIFKIIVVWELPKGNLSYMISGFGVVGILTHFFAYPIANSGRLIKLYCRYFYHFLALPTLILFLAIITKISEYGLTEERYLISIIAIWFASSCSYVVLHRSEKLRLVSIIVSALFIVSSFGPWSISRISGSNQVDRLRKLLIQENILQENKIVKSETPKSFEYNKKVSYIVYYLVSTEKYGLIKNWFPANSYANRYINRIGDRYKNDSIYSYFILADMGLYYVGLEQNEKPVENNEKAIENIKFSMANPPVFYNSLNEVKGFDYVANFSLNSPGNSFKKIETPNHDFKMITFISDDQLVVSDLDKNGISFDLRQLVAELKTSSNKQEDFIVYGENKKFHVKLYILYLQSKESKNYQVKDYSLNAVMLIKMLK